MTGPGEYRIARLLKVDERVYRMHQGKLSEAPIRSLQHVSGNSAAYNLLVMPGGTFIPADIVVHNKGCFLPESLILQSDGAEKPISAVRPGDPLLAYSPDGQLIASSTENGTISLWQTDGTLVRSWQAHAARSSLDGLTISLAFSPDGSLLASAANDGTIRLWGIRQGQ